MLEVRGLNQFYGGSHTLWDIDLDVPEGSCTCVMGRNGVGKTTLLKSIMGLLPLESGTIKINGEILQGKPANLRAQHGIGFVPQGREIFPQLTVEENQKSGLTREGWGIGEIPERIFELFPVLKEMLHRAGGNLSGGQQQQLALGRALAISPDLLILDEPTEGIQPNIVQQIGDVMLKLNKEENLTILLVEQKLAFARKVADNFYILDRGRIVAKGLIDELNDDLIHKHLVV